MMKNSCNQYDLYRPLPEHTITDLHTSNGKNFVTVHNLKNGESRAIEVSFCAILIGSRPDLRLLTQVSSSAGHPLSANSIVSRRDNSNSNKNPEDNSLTQESNDLVKIVARYMAWWKNLCAKCRRINNNISCDRNTRFIIESDDSETDCNSLYKICRRCDPKKEKSHHVNNEAGLGFGENPKKPIDCKNNPISVDKYTNQVLTASEGLYALGPLIGDNFVRFIPGGALAITAALHKLNEND